MEGIHPIGLVVNQTGLSTHVIRAWERRYQAINPTRSEGNQRLYSDADIHRLTLLAGAVENGASISRIARLPNEELTKLAPSGKSIASRDDVSNLKTDAVDDTIGNALRYIESSNGDNLRKELTSWLMSFGAIPVIERLVPELMGKIGERWGEGVFRIHQEHMATSVVRTFLGRMIDDMAGSRQRGTVISATPPGETHEIGALLCALAAKIEGFNAIHLGADVPFPEIIHLASRQETAAIMLSIVFSSRNTDLVQGLRSLRGMISKETKVFIGGRAAGWYGEQVKDVGIEVIVSIPEIRNKLKDLYR